MTNKNPKPISRYSLGGKKPTARKATIHGNVWKVGFWTYHQEEKVKFKNLEQSRDWAKKHGYDGIHVELEQ